MSYCTPCPPCDTNFPLLCEPLEITANGKRLVVEDSAACQKTIQSPVAQQVLKTDGANNLTWTNGGNSTVLGKDSAGKIEFATLNSVLQSGPVDLGSQPLTTTGAVTATTLTSTGPFILAADPTVALGATTKQYVDAADALKVNKAGDTMTGPLIVNSTIASNSTILANGNSSKIGYNIGAGGSVTQGVGARTLPVTLNRPTGIIITDNSAIAPNTTVSFILNNSVIGPTDFFLVTLQVGGTFGAYNIIGSNAFTGVALISIRNVTALSLSESLTLRFIVLKSVDA